jgi:ammonium transporter, Amt family
MDIKTVACTILGPRVGRFHDENGRLLNKPHTFPGHSVVLQSLGAFFLWFGCTYRQHLLFRQDTICNFHLFPQLILTTNIVFVISPQITFQLRLLLQGYGFICGSAVLLVTNTISKSDIAAKAVVNATLSAATAGASALLINMYICRCKDSNENKEKNLVFSLRMTTHGIVSGLVAISSGCATVDLFGSILIGIVASVIFIYGEKLIEYNKIDDVTSGISIFFFNGIWSMISTGLLSSPTGMKNAYGTDQYIGLFYEIAQQSDYSMNGILFTNQLIGICLIIVWAVISTVPLFVLFDYYGLLRSPIYDQVAGLDVSFHGGGTVAGKLEGENDLQEYSQRGHDNDILLN